MVSVLVHSPNWLGDAIMVMPAVQAFHALNPDISLGLACKKAVSGIWAFSPVPHMLHSYGAGTSEFVRVCGEIRKETYDRAILAPHTPRAALLALTSGIKERRSFSSGVNRLLLSDPVDRPEAFANKHQSVEYGYLFGLPNPEQLPPPELLAPDVELPDDIKQALRHGAVAMLPGAKRGPSKQWDPGRYAAAGSALAGDLDKRILVLGDPSEKELCDGIAAQIGSQALSLAGRTGFAQWLRVLSLSQCVVCNDSGGMHVASALGVPVVAIFGITDPTKTGPTSPWSRVLQKSETRSRAVPRISEEATAALNRITVDDVVGTCSQLMADFLAE